MKQDTTGGTQPILFLSEDAELIAAVAERLGAAGIELLAFPTVADLMGGVVPAAGAVLVLDTGVLPAGQDISSLMDQAERLWDGRPTLACIAHSSEIDLRLQTLRAGAEIFFVAPVAVDDLAARLLELSDAPGSDDYRILVVDDQPVAANFAVRVLERAGMQARSIGDPRHVLETIETFRPDLVLMDLHMPEVDGIELTALIREHEAVSATPVVFLSSELDTGRQMDTLRVGGNDFIAKPVRPEQLVATVRRNIRTFRRRQGRQPAGLNVSSPPLVHAEQAPLQIGGREGGKVGSQRPPVSADANSEHAARLTGLIEAALRSDGLYLVYQPIMALAGERDELYEVGPRLRALGGESIPASDFLPAAQRAGLLPAIDRQVLECALDRLRQERAAHPRLRFFLDQTLETLSAEEWLPWFRDQIVTRDLIKAPPILQFRADELSAEREVAVARFEALRRLRVKTCLNLPEDDPRTVDLIGDLGIALVRLPLPTATAPDTARLTELVARIHAAGAKLIAARIRDPRTIARVFGCGVDFIQGDFLQPPSTELGFDFGEAALV